MKKITQCINSTKLLYYIISFKYWIDVQEKSQ